MKRVVGMDAARGSSVVQTFVRRNEPYGALKTILHDGADFERWGEILEEPKEDSEEEPVVVLEAIITIRKRKRVSPARWPCLLAPTSFFITYTPSSAPSS